MLVWLVWLRSWITPVVGFVAGISVSANLPWNSHATSLMSTAPIIDNDRAKYIGNTTSLKDDQKYKLLTKPFTPSNNFHFPMVFMYGKNQSFQLSWLEKYPGLVYSPLLQRGLCKYCIFFSKKCSQLGPLVNSPFKQLHKAKEKLDEHFRKSVMDICNGK